VHDLIRGVAHLWQLHDQKNSGTKDDAYNFTAPEAVTQKQFTQTAAEVLHRPDWLPMPAFLMRLPLGEQADLLLEGQRVVPQKLTDTGFSFDYPDMRRALQDLL
jgi:NAD dependent epimerase/dehydratase family enzyme